MSLTVINQLNRFFRESFRKGEKPYIRPSILLILLAYGTLLIWMDQGTISASSVQGQDPNVDYQYGTPGLIPDLNLSISQYSWLGPCFTAGLIVGAFIFATLSNSYNELRLLAIGTLFWATGSLIAGFADTFNVMIFARILGGTGGGAVFTLTFPYIDDVAPPKHRTLWFGVLGLCQPVGIAIGYIGMGSVGSGISWRAAFWVQAGLGLPFVIAAALMPPVGIQTHEGQGLTHLSLTNTLAPRDQAAGHYQLDSNISRKVTIVSSPHAPGCDHNKASGASMSMQSSPQRICLPIMAADKKSLDERADLGDFIIYEKSSSRRKKGSQRSSNSRGSWRRDESDWAAAGPGRLPAVSLGEGPSMSKTWNTLYEQSVEVERGSTQKGPGSGEKEKGKSGKKTVRRAEDVEGGSSQDVERLDDDSRADADWQQEVVPSAAEGGRSMPRRLQGSRKGSRAVAEGRLREVLVVQEDSEEGRGECNSSSKQGRHASTEPDTAATSTKPGTAATKKSSGRADDEDGLKAEASSAHSADGLHFELYVRGCERAPQLPVDFKSSWKTSKFISWVLWRWKLVMEVIMHSAWNYNNLGYLPIEFVLQIFSYWAPYVARQLYPGFGASGIDLYIGATAVVAGVVGSVGGGLLLDFTGPSLQNGFRISCINTMLALICFTLCFAFPTMPFAPFVVLAGLGELFSASVNPINYALSMWTVHPSARPMSQALLNFSQRLLSDLTAPPIFGALHTRIDNWRIVANICVFYLIIGVFFYGVGWWTSRNSPDYRPLYEEQEARDIAAAEEAAATAAAAEGLSLDKDEEDPDLELFPATNHCT
ncbi:hypothetical protein CEUSTIGMA_g4011.t1 [Chlamydomonas eustigma]|uniref:Major facilitator superfamily (MFS) profile domain-containing protein n=1 Tax=Chlamydomonas eustigma TaxID=1157962 RepID=A0A250X0J4_9CHLO|nr:hypothetical protein CEUSTIGMA_g4011.t1 [Chlamydomonas eustigma]|eukprot:GAX76565.1 hypothetical protein CEUSTIGMA_g4011.t1 [Chlamydomonas eustigma]